MSYVDYFFEPERSGYGEFLDGLDAYLIGFRGQTRDGARFGWFDVSLYASLLSDDGTLVGSIAWPHARALHFGSDVNEPVVIAAIPEPSTAALLLTSGFLAMRIKKSNKAG